MHGFAPWAPRSKTERIMEQVQEIMVDMRPHMPLTCRQIFYQMVAKYDYPKDENAARRLYNYLGRARRAGMIRFSDIRDDGAASMHYACYEDVDALHGHIREITGSYRRDKLARQDVEIRVMCEAAGMMQQLAKICRDYSIPVYSCSGFDSLTYKHDLAVAVHDAKMYEGKYTIVLHLGDLDPSGCSIFDSLERDVKAFVGDKLGNPEHVLFHRVALDRDHVAEHNLPTYPAKSTDARGKEWRRLGLETCQLEALPPGVVESYLTHAIELFLDLDILAEDREAEMRERREITRVLPPAD